MRERRPWLLAGVALVAVAAAGHLETATATETQNRGIARLLALEGADWSSKASAFRLSQSFDCLLYKAGGDPYAVELCFDADGRIVEAIDRRRSSTVFWNLTFDPSASTTAVDPATLIKAFVAAGAATRGAATIPLGQLDRGPLLIVHKKPKPTPPKKSRHKAKAAAARK